MPVTAWEHLFSFVRLISLSQTGSILPFVFTRSDCHMTMITLIHWITIDHVLL